MTHAKQYLVSDYMNKHVVTLSPDATVEEAVELMIKKKTNGAVIVDKTNKVVGILSSWDIIAYLVPDYLEEDKHLATFEAGSVFASRVRHIAKDPISKCMTPNVHTIRPEASIMAAATMLSEFRIRQLPVVDENKVLVGYLNRTDIKRAVGDVLGFES